MTSKAKVAVVTGAARGIGLAIAARLLQVGRVVVIADIKEQTGAAAVASLKSLGKAMFRKVNLADSASIAAMLDWLDENELCPDVLVNNAGIAVSKPFVEHSDDDWARVLAVNLSGPFALTRGVARRMIDSGSGGAIVNISSVSGLRAVSGRTAYGVSKAGLIALTRQLALELADYGIRANCVAPGPIATEMASDLHQSVAGASPYLSNVPMQRYGSPSEIAEVVEFLCSPRSAYVTGQVIAVDGGLSSTGLRLPAG